MQSLFVGTDDKTADNFLNYLTESKCYDGKVVAAQTKNGNTDKKARDSRKQRADGHCNRKTQRSARYRGRKPRRRDNSGECADAHEARMTERELAEYTNGQVERDSHYNIAAGRNEQTYRLTSEHAAV